MRLSFYAKKNQTYSSIEKDACSTEAPEDFPCIKRIKGVIVR